MNNEDLIIIAEAGVNHNGSLKNALKLIDVAKAANVNYVKFQTFIPDKLSTKMAPKAQYQKNNLSDKESQLSMLKKLSLKLTDYKILFDYAKKKDISIISSVFDDESLELMRSLKQTLYKIPSGEITNTPLLRKISKVSHEVIISTGMASENEIKFAINIFKKHLPTNRIHLLHCVTEYPAPLYSLNLKSISYLKDKFGLNVGYSDHSIGSRASLIAVALGANIIEKHFTLSKRLDGPDHKSSLNKKELIQFVADLREVNSIIGNYKKEPSNVELKNIEVARKSIVSACQIKKGEKFSEKNLTTKRPGVGINPVFWDKIIGKKSKRDYQPDDIVNINEIDNKK